MYQSLTLIGNLGQDPELRYTPSGQAVCNLSVATNRKWTGNDGQKQEETTWFRVSVWGKQAEACNTYLSKGSKVLVVGRLAQDREVGGPRVWQDANGKARASFEVNAETVQFLSSRNDNSNGYEGGANSAQASIVEEDEIPF